jgi:hypothetical protein
MPILEKDRSSEGLGWFAGLLGIVAVALVFWNSFAVVLFLLAQLGGVETDTAVLSFFASALGLAGSIVLLIGLILLARHIHAKKPWLAAGCILLIAKNAIEILHGLMSYMAEFEKTQETLHVYAAGIGLELGQLVFWSFVLWLTKSWVPRVLVAKDAKKTDAPRLQGAQ